MKMTFPHIFRCCTIFSRLRVLRVAACFSPAARSARITSGPAWMFPPPTAGLTAEEAASARTASLGEQKWWEVFQDTAAAAIDSHGAPAEL